MSDDKTALYLKPSGLMALASVAIILGAGAGTVFAHYVYVKAIVDNDGEDGCVVVRSEASHGSGAGFVRAKAWSMVEVNYIPCIGKAEKPANGLRVKWDWLHWNGSKWVLCAFSPYKYNDHVTHQMEVSYDFGSGDPWCGNGWYGTWSDGWAKNSNNAWIGGPLWSGIDRLP